MKVGILGAGDVGKALARGFSKKGHEVMVGSRSPEKLDGWKTEEILKVGSFAETARFGDLVVLAVKGTVALDVLKASGADALKGKTVIDVTNPIADQPPQDGVLKFFTDLDESLMERLQTAYPETHFVKAFNSVGHAFMVDPAFPDGRPTMFICGDNDKAKEKVARIVESFGFEVEDMGKAAAARAIEPLCMLWCIPGFLHNEWGHAFKLLKR